jgi:hypothetical protein
MAFSKLYSCATDPVNRCSKCSRVSRRSMSKSDKNLQTLIVGGRDGQINVDAPDGMSIHTESLKPIYNSPNCGSTCYACKNLVDYPDSHLYSLQSIAQGNVLIRPRQVYIPEQRRGNPSPYIRLFPCFPQTRQEPFSSSHRQSHATPLNGQQQSYGAPQSYGQLHLRVPRSLSLSPGCGCE